MKLARKQSGFMGDWTFESPITSQTSEAGSWMKGNIL